jgi:hypothetical protein
LSSQCPQLLRVLFSTWMRSETRDADLWALLRRFCRGWRHRELLIVQWSAVLSGLTDSVLHFLWPSQGSAEVRIEWHGWSASHLLEFSPEHTIFCWNQMLNLLGNPNKIDQPKVHHLAMVAVSKIVDMFIGVGGDMVDYKTFGRILR